MTHDASPIVDIGITDARDKEFPLLQRAMASAFVKARNDFLPLWLKYPMSEFSLSLDFAEECGDSNVV